MPQDQIEKQSTDASFETLREPYFPPSSGVLAYVPKPWAPYAQLMRLDKPGGYYAFFFPYIIGLSYAACISHHPPQIQLLLQRAAIFAVSCIFLRGAACTWNDNIDQDLDRQVARCRNRPIARGAVSTTAGHIFTAAQTIIGSMALVFLPWSCAIDAIPIALLFGVYPFGKRFTNFPQLILGFPFAGAIVMAAHSIDISPLSKHTYIPTICMVFANVFWTMIYDTIYAHQDREDDTKAGVKSMAVKFKESTKLLCSILALTVVGLLVLTGWTIKASPMYYIMSCGGVAINLALMISTVSLETPESCAWWFKWGFWYVGGSLLGGMLLQYTTRI